MVDDDVSVIDPVVLASMAVASVDEPVVAAVKRTLRWAVLVAAAGVDDVPLIVLHDLGFVLLRGPGARLCGGRERFGLEGVVDDDERRRIRTSRVRFEDRILTTMLRDASFLAAHVVVAGTARAKQDSVIAHVLVSLAPRVLGDRQWPAQPIARWRALVDDVKALGDDDGADVGPIDAADLVDAAAVLDAIDGAPPAPVLHAEEVWELARLEVLPSEAARLALRTIHRLAASWPAPSPSLITRLKDRRHQVVLDDTVADVFPAGGFDAMSTRGTFENLVRSEVGYVGVGSDEPGAPDLFDVRYVEGELLYYTRDESPLLERRRQLVVVIEEAPRLRHKLIELPTQTLVLCEACVLRAFSDLQQALGANAVTLALHIAGDDDVVVAEEAAVVATSLASDVAHRRAAITSSSSSSSSLSMPSMPSSSSSSSSSMPLPIANRVTFSPRPAPALEQGRKLTTKSGLWVRVGGPKWTVTTSAGVASEIDPRHELRGLVDLLMLLA